jgi:enoyl-CoA hydratase
VAEKRLLTEQKGRVLVVQFTNPPRNFFDEYMAIELRDLVRDIDKDSALGAIIFTGKDTFVTHFNVPDLIRGAKSAPKNVSYGQARAMGAFIRLAERFHSLERFQRRTAMRDALTGARAYRAFDRMNQSDKVYIAAINGLALGMGAIVALACDLRLMADREDAAFGLIEQGISMLGAAGGTQRLTRMVGHSRAAQLLLEGNYLSPEEAHALGLIHHVVAPEDLQAQALSLGHRLAGRSPVLNQEVKRMIYEAGSQPLSQALKMEYASLLRTLSTPRSIEDMDRFVAEYSRHEAPTDRQMLDIWDKMLDTSDDREKGDRDERHYERAER